MVLTSTMVTTILGILTVLSFFGIIKGIFRKIIRSAFVIALFLTIGYFYANGITSVEKFQEHFKISMPSIPSINLGNDSQSTNKQTQKTDANSLFVERLKGNEKSNTNKKEQDSSKFGATIVLGDLDHKGRPTFAHILVSDSQEPGTNGIARPPKINVDPTGYQNFKIDDKYMNDRLHLVGFQFSGLNDEKRNLVTGTAYLNRGVEGSGSNQKNEDSMLYYEQQLDNWVRLHPNYKLDLYVKPIFENDNLTPHAVYMQWVGVDQNGNTIPIKIGGKSTNINEDYYGVTLKNETPSANINYKTGEIYKK